jgi:hypothetical protein
MKWLLMTCFGLTLFVAGDESVRAAEITGRAVDLRGNDIPTLNDLEVIAESLQGVKLNRKKATVRADGTYSLIVDDDLLAQTGFVIVTLRYKAPGRLDATIRNVAAQRNQTIDAVLPTLEDMQYYPSYEGYCAPPTCTVRYRCFLRR